MEGFDRDEYCRRDDQCIGCEQKTVWYDTCPRCSRLEGPHPLEEQNFEAESILNHLRDKYTDLDVEMEIGNNYKILKNRVNEILKNGGPSRTN